jgi:integrase
MPEAPAYTGHHWSPWPRTAKPWSKEPPPKPDPYPRDDIELIERWLDWRGFAHETRIRYREAGEELLEYLYERGRHYRNMTSEDIALWVEAERLKHVPPDGPINYRTGVMYQHIATIAGVIKYGRAIGYITHDVEPFKLPTAVTKGGKERLTRKEVFKIINAALPEEVPSIALLFLLYARAGDLVTLRWRDVTWMQDGGATVRIRHWTHRGDRDFTRYLDPVATKYLRALYPNAPPWVDVRERYIFWEKKRGKHAHTPADLLWSRVRNAAKRASPTIAQKLHYDWHRVMCYFPLSERELEWKRKMAARYKTRWKPRRVKKAYGDDGSAEGSR